VCENPLRSKVTVVESLLLLGFILLIAYLYSRIPTPLEAPEPLLLAPRTRARSLTPPDLGPA
jgi:hypothetical protein